MTDVADSDWKLRVFRSGDVGMIGARQAAIYAEEWGWGQPLESLIYEICARFLREFKPGREQCWVAERAGTLLGGVFLVEEPEQPEQPEQPDTARLRLLYVEPDARGLGVGRALVRQCTEFARAAGYQRIVLWTHAVLLSARRIYEAEGYVVIGTEVQHKFGKPEKSEFWQLEL